MKRTFSPQQKNYKKAKATHDKVKRLEQQAKNKVLGENEFLTVLIPEEIALGEKVERILDPISDFRMSEEDFITYCKLLYVEYKRLGIKIPNYNTTQTIKHGQH